MKWLLSIVGVVLELLGLLWILQGTNVIATGFMAGHVQYAFLGLVALVVGTALLVSANRRRKDTPSMGR